MQFIGPPLTIRGAEHVFEMDNSKPKEPVIRYRFCYRRKESYAASPDGVPPDWKDRDFGYRERVSTYSELNWGEQLVWDRSVMSAMFHLADPGSGKEDHPLIATKEVLAMLSETIENINGTTDFRPAVESLDRAIIACSKERAVMLEMVGDRLPFAAYNCSRCGGGLLSDRCNFCNTPIVANMASRVETRIPLPPQVAREIGDIFTTSPIQSLKGAYREWANQNYHPPLSMPGEARQRSVVLRDEDE